mgnify:CR=1 FL=1
MKLSRIYLSLFCVAAISACGGSSDTTANSAAKTLDVQAIDGYLKDATVWLDVDGDYTQDAGEPSAQTDGTGKATLDVTAVDNPAQYRVLVKAIVGQTTDVGDGKGTPKPVTKAFTMSAPAGVSTVTPLTTLVAQQMAANTEMSQEQAAQEVALVGARMALAVLSAPAVRRRWFTLLMVLCTAAICYSRIYLAKQIGRASCRERVSSPV